MILFLSFALVFNIIPIISILLAADSVFLIYIPSSISFLFYVACGMVVSHIINQKLIEINLRESNNGTGLAIMLNSMRYFSSTDLNWSDPSDSYFVRERIYLFWIKNTSQSSRG